MKDNNVKSAILYFTVCFQPAKVLFEELRDLERINQ